MPDERPRSTPPTPPLPHSPAVLVVDVGGTNVKVRATGWKQREKVPSGPEMGPAEMVAKVRALVGVRPFDVIAMGYPGPVIGGVPAMEPHNLAPGWVGFDFAAAFGAPVRTINDAAMQALGNYAGGHMLFLGFGTGLGSALIADGVVCPLELAHLPYRNERTYEQYVGVAARQQLGDRRWQHHCRRVAALLRQAMQASDIVIGGGNAKHIGRLPAGMRLGTKDAAFKGGVRLWEERSR